MLTNKDIEVIRLCLKTSLVIIRGKTDGAKKARTDIKETLKNFDEYICDLEDERDNN